MVAAAGTHNPKEGGMSNQVCQRCDIGQDSINGSAECTVCSKEYYRPFASSATSDCALCSAIRGVGCDFNTTITTLSLKLGYWRHTPVTTQTHLCRSEGSW
eukprot:1612893-Prymnesium_polylepis.1